MSEPIKVDLAGARNLLWFAVLARGRDYVYTPPGEYGGCQYFEGDEPSCIVGHVLNYLGVTLEDINHNSAAATTINREQDKVEFSYEAVRYLRAAQLRQDTKCSWGESFDEAEEFILRQGWV